MVFSLPLSGFTQDGGFTFYSKPNNGQDSNYLRTYGDYFVPALYTIRHFSSFHIVDRVNKTQLNYEPNISLGVGICASYKWLGVAGSMAFGFLNRDDEVYGKTKKIDFYTNLYTTRFLYDLNFQQYNGYYIGNPRAIDTSWKVGDTYYKRPDIRTSTIGMAVYYIWNNKHFSLKAPYNYCDEQLHSAGSLILGGFFSGYGMQADSSIIPSVVVFQDSIRYKSIGAFDIGFSGGYAYTLVFGRKKHWFISGMLLPGISNQLMAAENIYGKVPGKFSLSIKTQTRLAIGYSKPRFYWGWVVVYDAFNLSSSATSAYQYKSGYTCMSVGTRILPPKQWKKKPKEME